MPVLILHGKAVPPYHTQARSRRMAAVVGGLFFQSRHSVRLQIGMAELLASCEWFSIG